MFVDEEKSSKLFLAYVFVAIRSALMNTKYIMAYGKEYVEKSDMEKSRTFILKSM